MTRANPMGLIEGDSEIMITSLRRLQESSTTKVEVEIEDRESAIMAGPRRKISKYDMPQFIREKFNVPTPTVMGNNFEIKANTIGVIQNSHHFDGLTDEDPNAHLLKFLQICSMFKMSTISDDAIRLRFFFIQFERVGISVAHFFTLGIY